MVGRCLIRLLCLPLSPLLPRLSPIFLLFIPGSRKHCGRNTVHFDHFPLTHINILCQSAHGLFVRSDFSGNLRKYLGKHSRHLEWKQHFYNPFFFLVNGESWRPSLSLQASCLFISELGHLLLRQGGHSRQLLRVTPAPQSPSWTNQA